QPAVAPTATAGVTATVAPTAAATSTQPAATATVAAVATQLPASATPQASPTAALPVLGTISATIPVGTKPYAIAVDTSGIWVTDANDGTVTRIDPASNQIAATIHVAPPVDGEN